MSENFEKNVGGGSAGPGVCGEFPCPPSRVVERGENVSGGVGGVAGIALRSRLLVIDTETGGLDPARHALLSVGLVDSLTDQMWGSLVRPAPGLGIEEEALGVNGLSVSLLEEDGFAEGDVVGMIERIGKKCRGAVLAGCNVGFDVGFLRAAFERCGVCWPFSHRTLDIRGVAWLAHECGAISLPLGKNGPRLDLDAILEGVGLFRAGKHHSAMEDAALTLYAFRRLVAAVGPRAGKGEN